MELRNSGEPLNIEKLKEFEEKYAVSLPEDYKAFLLKTNGGFIRGFYVTQEFDELDTENNIIRKQQANVQKFFPLNKVAKAYEDILDDPILPPGFLPIANDPFGNNFIICTKQNNDFGSIWFANHELWDKETGFWVYSKISNTFNGFLSSLTIFEE